MGKILNRAVAFAVLLFYSAGLLPAAEWSRGYSEARRTLDFYLERASNCGSIGEFERVAQSGLEAARAQWESLAEMENFTGAAGMAEERAALDEALEAEKDSVFESWLLEKKNAEINSIKKSELFSILKSASEDFFYTDSEGVQSRVVSEEDIQNAQVQWSAAAEKIVADFIEEYKKSRPESEWPSDAEFDSMLKRLSNALTDTLLYDHDSLKKMSDDEAARVIAENLAAGVEGETRRAMQALFDSMQESPAAHNLDNSGENEKTESGWLKKFEDEMERGLEKWNSAEEEFLAARVEWEKSAESIFIDGNEKWQAAYESLEKRKNEWAEKMAEEIRTGKIEWKNKSESLAAEIDEYLLQFEKKLALESAQKASLLWPRRLPMCRRATSF